jgi:hypothetical protein
MGAIMRHVPRIGLVLLTLSAVTTFLRADPLGPPPATQQAVHQPAKPTDFLRFVDNGAEGGRLETADVAFRNADGVTVHLVAAVHIGEREYFEGLNQNFKLRDAVLYEMVKGKDQPLPEPGGPNQSHSSVSQFQRYLKDALNLEFQLDCIDYTQPNFIHADLDAETFQKMQDDRGESMTMLMLKQMWQQMQKPQTGADNQDGEQQLEDLVRVFTRPDSERRMKTMLAKQLVSMEGDGGFDVMNGTVLLTERNKAAIQALETTLKTGKKDIAIFYGAAHMPDLTKRLEDMGFTPVATEWRMAWNLTIREDQPSAVENVLIDLIRGMKDLDQ